MAEPNNLATTPGVIESRNPLEVIGWTYAVLQLRLTDEQYHQKAKKEAQFLFIIHHEDNGGLKEMSQHYAQAYKDIKDEQSFKKALRDFREERNERARSDSDLMQSLRVKVNTLEREIEVLQENSRTGKNGVIRLSEVNDNLTKFLASRGLDVSISSPNGLNQTSSLHLVKSIDVITVRISGLDKVSTVTKPGDLVYTGQEIRLNKELPIVPNTVDGYHHAVRWGSFRSFLMNNTHYSRHVIIRHEKFEVENGALIADYEELTGTKIIGTIKPLRIFNTRTSRFVLTEIQDVVGNISPYVSTLNMLLIDRKPKVVRNAAYNSGPQTEFIKRNLEEKIGNYKNNAYKRNASTHLKVLGMVVGINN